MATLRNNVCFFFRRGFFFFFFFIAFLSVYDSDGRGSAKRLDVTEKTISLISDTRVTRTTRKKERNFKKKRTKLRVRLRVFRRDFEFGSVARTRNASDAERRTQ